MPAKAATTIIKQNPLLLGIGIRAVLHRFKGPGMTGLDTSENLLYGYRITSFNRSGTTIEQTQVTAAGLKELFAPGKVVPGDISLGLVYDPELGDPPVMKSTGGLTYVPEAVLFLGFLDPDASDTSPELLPFIEIPCNISEFGEINMQEGQAATSSIKLKECGDGMKIDNINDGDNILYKGSAQ